MLRILFHAIFLMVLITANGQGNQNKPFPDPSLVLRFNPGAFIEHEAGVMLGVGYRWSPSYSATLDPMFIFYKPYPDLDMSYRESVSGIKIKSDFRFHISRFLGFRNVYFGPDLHYKGVVTKRTEKLGINCIQGQCDYFMLSDYRQVMNEIGAALKGGIEVFSNNDRWYIELYGGLGFKLGYYEEKGIPPGGSFTDPPERETFFGRNRDGIAYPNLPCGLKLGYRIL